jgi:tetraacyldisaccharide-1-P 4'-kinase
LRMVTSDSAWQDVGDEPLILHLRTGCMTLVASVAPRSSLRTTGCNICA